MTTVGPLFGPAGRGEGFAQLGLKKTEQVPDYVAHYGLTAFEYQAGHGVRLNPATGAVLAAGFAAAGIAPSLHAPYYISLASAEPEKRENSLGYLLASAKAVQALGGNRVIFHCGGAGKMDRAEAFALAADTLARARALLDAEGLSAVHLCPETMGKKNQLGSLDEVLTLCKQDKRHIPCLDFGHLNAVSGGQMRTQGQFEGAAGAIADALDDGRAKSFHVHFSKIEYTAAGERRHLTFADSQYGPPFEPFLECCAKLGLAPTVICESAGTQEVDAQTMMKYYKKLIRRSKQQ